MNDLAHPPGASCEAYRKTEGESFPGFPGVFCDGTGHGPLWETYRIEHVSSVARTSGD